MRYAMRTAGLAAALTTITLAAGLAPATGTARAPGSTHPADDLASLGAHRIRHVIEIMLENHTYANLFPVHVRRRHAQARAIRAPANEGECRAVSPTAGRRNCGRCTTARARDT